MFLVFLRPISKIVILNKFLSKLLHIDIVDKMFPPLLFTNIEIEFFSFKITLYDPKKNL